MATVPALIYLNQPINRATPSQDVYKDLVLNLSSEEDDILDKSKWGIQPGVWWKDENKWVLYDQKIATRIMKAEEIGVSKIQFHRSPSAYFQFISVHSPLNSPSQIEESMYPKRVADSSDSGSTSSPIGAPAYEVDLIKMEELHLESGRRRHVKIVKVSMTGYLFRILSTSNASTVKFRIDVKKSSKSSCQNFEWGETYSVSWKDDIEGWCLYNDHSQRAIWSAWAKGDNFVSVEILRWKNSAKITTQYIVDLKKMQQINAITRQREPIQIAMWISSSHFPQMWIRETPKYLTRQIEEVNLAETENVLHKLALSRLLCSEYVKEAISESMEPQTLQSMELNTHVDLAENGHWNRFLHSFMQTVKEVPEYSGHLWRFALNPNGRHHPFNPFTSRNSKLLWRFVFGAPSGGGNAHSLIKPGIETMPSKYDTSMDWFGLNSTITELHCKPVAHGVVSMLVFLVLLPKEFKESREKVVFIKKVKDHLPVARITVRVDDSTLGLAACSLWEEKHEENSQRYPPAGLKSREVSRPLASPTMLF